MLSPVRTTCEFDKMCHVWMILNEVTLSGIVKGNAIGMLAIDCSSGVSQKQDDCKRNVLSQKASVVIVAELCGN